MTKSSRTLSASTAARRRLILLGSTTFISLVASQALAAPADTVLAGGVTRAVADDTFGTDGIIVDAPSGLSLAEGVTIANAVTLNDTLTLDADGAGATLSGAIDGVGELRIGGGSLTLTGPLNYTGATTVLADTNLTLGATATGGSMGPITIDGTLTVNRADDFLIEELHGDGLFVKAGTGVAALYHDGSFTGDVNIADGALYLNSPNALDDARSVTLSGANAVLDLGIYDIIGSANVVRNFSGVSGSVVKLGMLGTLIVENDDTGVFAGTIQSSNYPGYVGTLYSAGSGTLILTGQNDLRQVWVEDGTLALAGAGTLGDRARVDVYEGTLDLSGVTSGAVTLSELTGTDATVALGGTMLTLLDPGDEFMGAFTGTGGLHLESGWLGLTGTQSYTGDTVIDQDASLYIAAADFAGAMRVDGLFDIAAYPYDSSIGGLSGSGAVQLGDNRLTLNGGGTFSGVIRGTSVGTLAVAGGVLTLTGDSSDFGGGAIVSGGELVVDGRLGDASSTLVVTGGTLSGAGQFGGAVTVTAGGSLSGTAGRTLSMDTLTLEAGSVTEVALSRPSDAALFDVAGDLTLGGTLNVTGLPGYGAGVYRLFDYGGALTNNGMTLSRAGGASSDGLSLQTATIGQVNLVDRANATLAFWDGDALANRENGLIEGGAGTWNLTNRNWTDADGAMNGAMSPAPGFAVFQGAGGVVTIDNGAGQVGATGLQFTSNGYTLKGGALALSGAQAIIRVGDGSAAGANTSATIAASLTGASALVKSDLGTLFLTGANSYTGGTLVQAGILVGDAASIRGDVRNDGVVVFNQTSNATFTGAISGAGAMVKTGSGALTLGGASNNDWRIVDGSLISTSALFTGDVEVEQGGKLIFDQAADGVYSGTLTGAGSVIVRGGGVVRFTGDGSRFQGGATVGGGTGNNLLSVNGVLGGVIEVLAGARLQGNGTIGGGRIAGTIAPGNSIGTLTVNGDLSILSGGVFEVEADASGQSDKVVVTGSATIESGATLSVLAANGNYAPNTRYSVLTAAGGVTGTFSNVTSNLAFLTPSLSYGGGVVTLDLKRNTIDFDAVAQTVNQQAVAPMVEALGQGNAVYDATITLTAPEARAAFDQLAGSDHASLRASLLEDSRFMRDAILSRADAAGEEGLMGWGRVVGAQRKVDSDVEAQGFKRDLDGFVTGLDGALNDHWRAGLAFGYTDSELRTAWATHQADSYQLGGGMLGNYGRVTVQVGGVYAWHSIESRRRVTFGGLDERLSDKYGARSFQGFGEVALRARVGSIDFQPFAGLAHVALFDADVNETGGAAALHGGEDGADASYGTLGARARVGWDLGGSRLSLDGAVAVRRTFDAQAPLVDMAFATGSAFRVGGVPLDRTEATLDLGLRLDLSPRVQLGVSYGGVYSDRSTDQGGRAELIWRF